MSEMHPPRQIGRSIGALLAGFLAVVILSLATDVALYAAGVFPPLGMPLSDTLCLLAAAYRTVYAIAGSYVTARLAPYRPMGHALVGGAVGVAVSTLGAAATWSRTPALGPHWYPVALIVLSMPCAWAGGEIRVIELRARPKP